MGGIFRSPSEPAGPKPAPIRSVGSDEVRQEGDALRARRQRRRGGLATILTETGGTSGDYAETTGTGG